ncbi:MAG TPA: sulfurtransferase [Flavobacteriaceae bacterium]|nr:sulfurtransferase [Flavobacteriaceae bacterium]
MFFKKILKMLTSNSNVENYLQEGALLLDVRTKAEFLAGHHADAVNIPLQELEVRLKELPSKKILTVCRSGARSAQAATILNKNGFDAINGGPWQTIK